MSASPLVSIVMPAYNHEKFVGEAIDSVLNQTWQHLELIIIDDGSTDKTADIVKAYDDPRVHYFHQDNQDAYNALNAGLEKTNGDFIGIINSDDVFHTARIETLLALMSEHNAQAIFSDVSPIDAESAPLSDPEFGWNHWHQANRRFYARHDRDVYQGFLHGNLMVTTSNLLMSAAAKDTIGGFAPYRYLHDYDYLFRLLNAFPEQVHYAEDAVLLNYRIHGNNTISEAAITGREQDQEIIRNAVLAQLPAATHARANVGIDRLITLELELMEARKQLNPQVENAPKGKLTDDTPTRDLAALIVKRLLSKIGLRR